MPGTGYAEKLFQAVLHPRLGFLAASVQTQEVAAAKDNSVSSSLEKPSTIPEL